MLQQMWLVTAVVRGSIQTAAAHAPSVKRDTIVPGIAAAVHVLDVLNSRAQGPVLAQPSAVVIIQLAVIPVATTVPVNQNVQAQINIVLGEFNTHVQTPIRINAQRFPVIITHQQLHQQAWSIGKMVKRLPHNV